MVPEKPKMHSGSRYEVTLLDGLSDLKQAAIAREYERRTGRPFRCGPCLETVRPHATPKAVEADEPASEVVAILEYAEGPIPVCEGCYRRIRDAGGIT